jgi:hypothetical protein
MLDNIKVLLKITDETNDDILNLLRIRSLDDILNYIGINELDINISIDNIIDDLTILKYNRLDNQYIKSESVGPLTTTYVDNVDGLPDSIKQRLIRYKKIRVVL